MRCGLKLFTGNHVISVLRTCQAGPKEAQLPAALHGRGNPVGVGHALCVQPPVAKRSITQKNTQNTSKSILESNRMKNQMSVTDLPAASRPLVGPTGPDVPVTTVISQTIGPLK